MQTKELFSTRISSLCVAVAIYDITGGYGTYYLKGCHDIGLCSQYSHGIQCPNRPRLLQWRSGFWHAFFPYTFSAPLREGLAEAEALAYAIAPYVQLVGSDIRRRQLERLSLHALPSLVQAAVAKGLLPDISPGACVIFLVVCHRLTLPQVYARGPIFAVFLLRFPLT